MNIQANYSTRRVEIYDVLADTIGTGKPDQARIAPSRNDPFAENLTP